MSSVFPFVFRLSLEQISGSETATRSCERVAITIFHRREQAITTDMAVGEVFLRTGRRPDRSNPWTSIGPPAPVRPPTPMIPSTLPRLRHASEVTKNAVEQRDGIPVGDRIFRKPYFDPQGRMTIQQWNTASQGVDYRLGPARPNWRLSLSQSLTTPPTSPSQPRKLNSTANTVCAPIFASFWKRPTILRPRKTG